MGDFQNKKILAVIFPGVGYHHDKPLLYYGQKILKNMGAEIVYIYYGELPSNIMHDAEKKKEAFLLALDSAKQALKDIEFSQYENIVFVGKSIGTAVSLALQAELGIRAVNVLYTPVEQTFRNPARSAIAFFGSNDPWIDAVDMHALCGQNCDAFYQYQEANHSLETGEVLTDLANMQDIMHKTFTFLQNYLK